MPLSDLGLGDVTVLGGIFATAGALATEALRRLLPTRDAVLVDGTTIRTELWSQLASLQGEMRTLRSEVDGWQQRYYDLQVAHTALQTEHQVLRRELEDMRARMAS